MTDAVSFVLSLDTEEDNWDPVREGASTENVRELPRFVEFLARRGVRPTFFTNYEVARRPWAAGLLRDLAADGRGEVAAHLHPWNTPPFTPEPPGRATMLCHYPAEAQQAKIAALRDIIAEHTGLTPTSFRAGRFGAGRETIEALIQTGFTVDSSVTPFHSWARFDDGPDFSGAPTHIYRLDGRGDLRTPVADGPIVEVPVSAGYTRFRAARWPGIATFSRGRPAMRFHLPGLAARAGLVQRTLLSPEVASVRHMLALSRRLVDAGTTHLQLFLHSSSLRPGLTPFVTSRTDLQALYDALDRYLDALAALTPLTFRTVAEAAAGTAPAVAAWGGAPTPATAPHRLLVVDEAYAAGTDGGPSRWVAFAKYLTRRGWDVHVLTAAAAGLRHLRDGAQVHAIAGARLAETGWRRGVAAGLQARELVRRFQPDVVITSGPPHAAHLAGGVATLGTAVPRVMDLHEAWTGQGERGGVVDRLLRRLLRPPLLRSALHVFAATPELAEEIDEFYPGVRGAVVRDGTDPEEFALGTVPPLPPLSVATIEGLDGDRTAEPVLRALRLFLERHPGAAPSTRLRIAGPAAADVLALLAARIHDHGLERNVEVLGQLPRAQALELLAASQVAVVLAQHQGSRVPGALHDALGLGLRTVVCAERESAAGREALRLGTDVRELADIEGIARAFTEAWRKAPATLLPGAPVETAALVAERLDALLRPGAEAAAGRTAEAGEPPTLREYVLQGEPRVNWMWLAEPSGWDRALEVCDGPPALEPALRLRFAAVDACDCTTHAGDGPLRLPYGDATFDCVAVHGSWGALRRRASADRPDEAVLREFRRVLRPGGCLYVAERNLSYRRLFRAGGGGATVGAMRRAFLAAGFARVQGYYVTPSFDFPGNIIPITRRAALEYERFTAARHALGPLRRIVAALGLHRVLYPSLTYLAHR